VRRRATCGQSWLHPSLAVGRSAIHGRGVFATEGISRGERVAVFGGDVMAISEIDVLRPRYQSFPMQIEERFVLGSRASRSEPADRFNHSCAPNCGFRGQVFLVTMRPIRRGEEVTFDYAMTVSESRDSDVVFEMTCNCGSPECRGTIRETDWRLPLIQRRYEGYFSQYIEERIAARTRKRPARANNSVGGQ
jgi:uncharacterized protein